MSSKNVTIVFPNYSIFLPDMYVDGEIYTQRHNKIFPFTFMYVPIKRSRWVFLNPIFCQNIVLYTKWYKYYVYVL